ncbi:GTP cyclohydrolase I [Schumannella soli]|uniref:GTP cyclohydrolase 1 n=1 Tax=Schumannella soli TaxID=2590779 RepID=A0A506XXA7_9MICO|nr:GTP cyclohydrolase I [Schumannella soli]TPW74263.1 GTP cyclohydrolase I [Schumannella soli]
MTPSEAVPDAVPFDLPSGERAVAELLRALGQDPDEERLRRTPERFVQMLANAIQRDPLPPASFIDGPASRDLVVVHGIPFRSLCEHHLLPFRGVAHVGYLPGERLVGVSLPVRVVEHFARGLQLQERLTEQVADWLDANLEARGVGVVIEAEHQCMSFRGIGDAGTTLLTSAFRGEVTALPSPFGAIATAAGDAAPAAE